jgi:hypothetical protein
MRKSGAVSVNDRVRRNDNNGDVDDSNNDNNNVTAPLIPIFISPSQQQQHPSLVASSTYIATATTNHESSSLLLMQYGSTIHEDTTTATTTDDITQSPRFNRVSAQKKRSSWCPTYETESSLSHDPNIHHTTTTTTATSTMDVNFADTTTTTTKSEHTATTTASLFVVISQQLKPFLYYIIYAVVNVIISVPGLYGYAAIIFNHSIFIPYRNTLSKLVIVSSLVHQLAFTSCSTIHTFAIGTVQDAGLIFLSTMANHLANTILIEGDDNEDGSNISKEKERIILSTVLVLLSFGTATLGLVLILMGHYRLAEYVRSIYLFLFSRTCRSTMPL